MRCAVCLQEIIGRDRCTCGARVDEAKHRELMGVRYLLGQITHWEEAGTVPAATIAQLRSAYQERRDVIKRELLKRAEPAPKPELPRANREAREDVEIIEVRDTNPVMEIVEETAKAESRLRDADVASAAQARVANREWRAPEKRPSAAEVFAKRAEAEPPPSETAPEPRSARDVVRNLFTERNVRWLLSIGIGIFVIALAVFIHRQWRSMDAPVKVAILFGGTLATGALGFALRRTTLHVTGSSLIVLAAIALPIDFFGVVQFTDMTASAAERVGWLGSVVCIATYATLAVVMRAAWPAAMALVAGAGLMAFSLRFANVGWARVAALLPALMFVYAEARARFVKEGLLREPLRWVPPIGFAVLLTAVLGLVVFGELDLKRDYGYLQVALATAAVAARLAAKRTDLALWSWASSALGSLVFLLILHWYPYGWPPKWEAQWMTTWGTVLSFAWLGWLSKPERRKHAAAYIAAGIVFQAWGLLKSFDFVSAERAVFVALTMPGLTYLAFGWRRRNPYFYGTGAALVGGGLLAFLLWWRVNPWWFPLPFALYGFAHVASAARWRTREQRVYDTAIFSAAAAAGVAFIFIALYTLVYFHGKVDGVARPGMQWLGVACCVLAGAVFGPIAHWQKSRYVSDVTYGALGFAYVYALRALGLETKWVGCAILPLAVGYFAAETYIRRWLLRPSLLTGVLATAACLVFAGVQTMLGLHIPPAISALGVGAFYLAVARLSPYRAVAHVGTYLLAAGGYLLLSAPELGVPAHWRALWLMPVAAGPLLWAWWEDRMQRPDLGLHLAISGIVVLTGLLTFTFLNGDNYDRAHLPPTIGVAAATALLAGFFAFAKPERVDHHVGAVAMAFFASLAYLLTLKYYSRGTPYGPLVVFALAPVMCGAAVVLRARGFQKQARSIAIVSGLIVAAAFVAGVGLQPNPVPAYLYVSVAALALYATVACLWRSTTMMAYAATALIICTCSIGVRLHESTVWAATIASALPLAALAASAVVHHKIGREPGIALLVGAVAATGLCALAAATNQDGRPWGGAAILLIALGAVAASELHRALSLPIAHERSIRILSAAVTVLAIIASFDHQPQLTGVLAAAFLLYYGIAERLDRVGWLVVSCVFALGAELAFFDYLRANLPERGASLAAMTVPMALFALGWWAYRRKGDRFATPLLGATAVGASMATLLGIGQPIDRVLNLLAVAVMAGLAALYMRRPWMMFVAGGALMLANLAAMVALDVPVPYIAVEVIGMSLVMLTASRALGPAVEAYARPFFTVALVAGVLALVTGVAQGGRYVSSQKDCQAAIGGLVLSALLFGAAGRSERKPAFYYLGGVNAMGAYYLALQWFRLGGADVALEWTTAPVGLALMAWSAFVVRDTVDRGWVGFLEALAVGMLTVPSGAASFATAAWHALALYGLALGVILAGMAFRRKAYLVGGTAAMIVETVGKAIEFLVLRGTSLPEWGLLIGGFMIVLAALFESRKTAFMKERLEAARVGAQEYFRDWR